MKIPRVCSALIVLITLFSGCARNSVQTIANTVSPTTAINSHLPEKTTEIASSTPTERAITSPSPSAAPTATKASIIVFNEDNFTQYFQFGMSGENVKKKLKEMGNEILYDSYDVADSEHGWGNFQVITAIKDSDYISFYIDINDQLYMIDGIDWNTANGIKTGDSPERIRSLYGKENERAEYQTNSQRDYVYDKNGYFFSISTDRDPQTGKYTVDSWSVFANIWNDHNFFKLKNHKSYTGDDSIQFNEDNFSKLFHFGMSRQAVEKKLTDLGIRITNEYEERTDIKYWYVYTDHIEFNFNPKNKLASIKVKGWDTAKGLKEGDSENKLQQLYGKGKTAENEDIIMYKKGSHTFSIWFENDASQGALAVDCWSVEKN